MRYSLCSIVPCPVITYHCINLFLFTFPVQFVENREPWEGANCHKAIMFFSDGGTEWPHELSAHLCNESTEDCVRVFTYGCGPHPIPTVVLKSMACRTRGYFSSITALGAIQNRVQVL